MALGGLGKGNDSPGGRLNHVDDTARCQTVVGDRKSAEMTATNRSVSGTTDGYG